MPGTRRRFTSEKAETAEQVRLQRENKRLEQEKENLKRVRLLSASGVVSFIM